MKLWSTYMRLLKERPIVTNMVSGAVVMGAGDMLAQTIEEAESLDVRRTVILSSWQSFIITPYYTGWYKLMDKWYPTNAFHHISRKTALTAFNTWGINALFFAYITTLEFRVLGKSLTETKTRIIEKLENDWVTVCINSNLVWVPIFVINWKYMPLHLRPLCINSAAVLWNAYLSLVQHRENPERHRKSANSADSSLQPLQSVQGNQINSRSTTEGSREQQQQPSLASLCEDVEEQQRQ